MMVRRRIMPLRWLFWDTARLLVGPRNPCPEWELLHDITRSRSSQEIDGAFFNYKTHPQRSSDFAQRVLGRPSFGRALKFYLRLKKEWTAMQEGKTDAARKL